MKKRIIEKNEPLQKKRNKLKMLRQGEISITPKNQHAKNINSKVEKLNNEKLSMGVRNYEV